MHPVTLTIYRAHRAAGLRAWHALRNARVGCPAPYDNRAEMVRAAYGRMADPAWRSCNTDAFCNTPRQLWAQAWCDARYFAHIAQAQQG